VVIPESLGDLRSLAFLYLDRARLAGMFLGWSDPTDHLKLTDFLPPSPQGTSQRPSGTYRTWKC
jgi:hypothetical protein